MFFDGVMQRDGAGAGIVLVSPKKHILPYSFILVDLFSNNVAEYQPLILGFQMAIGMGIKDLDVYGDSQLVINQLLEEFEVKKDDLIPHHKNVLQLLDKWKSLSWSMFLGVPTKWLTRLQTLQPLWH